MKLDSGAKLNFGACYTRNRDDILKLKITGFSWAVCVRHLAEVALSYKVNLFSFKNLYSSI